MRSSVTARHAGGRRLGGRWGQVGEESAGIVVVAGGSVVVGFGTIAGKVGVPVQPAGWGRQLKQTSRHAMSCCGGEGGRWCCMFCCHVPAHGNGRRRNGNP